MNDVYRPAFHFTPPSNWMNDPNGLVYFEGEYHLFYQYHPNGTTWGPMHWGHAVSTNLIHWQHLPIALYPDENGMIFSGSAVVDMNNTAGFGENTLVAIFTYNLDHTESQNLAYSTDRGRTWTKYAGNPVIINSENLKDFRDPKVFWCNDCWVMALAAGKSVYFYRSVDLKHWDKTGIFGNGEYGSTKGVWETPDLFKLKVDSTPETRWVLTVGVGQGGPSEGSGTQYFIGNFNGENFVSENSKETILWVDHGADYYASQSWNNEPTGRCIMLAWMSNWLYAREVPSQGWRGVFALPREVTLTRTDNGLRLLQSPIRELHTLREKMCSLENHQVTPGENPLGGLHADAFELITEVKVESKTEEFGFRVRKGEGEQTTISCNVKAGKVFVERNSSGIVNFHETFSAVHPAPIELKDNTLRLQLFVDHCSVEVFLNDGLVCLSHLIYPSANSDELEFFTVGGEALLNSLDIYKLTAGMDTIQVTTH